MGSPLVSVLTPTVPERAGMLAECRLSVEAQHGVPFEHLVGLDTDYQGCAVTINELARHATGKWLFLIADDDLLHDPACLKAHVSVSGAADVVYSPPRVEGEPEAPFHGDPPGIPAPALIRRTLWERLGGYDEMLDQCEDLDFFRRALESGARFQRLDEQLWTYRIGHPLGNKSRGKTWP